MTPEGPQREDILAALERVLNSADFRGSKRCYDFLHYVVMQSLTGNADHLKERTLAAEIFGRNSDVDLTEDTIVRVGAREVRKRLSHYYAGDGSKDPLHIDLPVGSYVPVFRFEAGSAAGDSSVPASTEPASIAGADASGRLRRHNLWAWLFGAALILAVAVAGLLSLRHWLPEPEPFDVFWKPALNHSNPVYIVLAHPIVYRPSSRAWLLNDERNPPPDDSTEEPINLPPKALDGSDFVPVFDHFVGLGDAVAAVDFARMFEHRGRPINLRLASKLEMTELRGAPAVLIGAFTNRWTKDLMQGTPYHFSYAGKLPALEDTVSHQSWVLGGKTPDDKSQDDFVLIMRLMHSRSGSFTVLSAGLSHYGTQEASRILTTPSALSPLLRRLPQNWSNSNVALILRCPVLGDSPGLPELAASRVW